MKERSLVLWGAGDGPGLLGLPLAPGGPLLCQLTLIMWTKTDTQTLTQNTTKFIYFLFMLLMVFLKVVAVASRLRFPILLCPITFPPFSPFVFFFLSLFSLSMYVSFDILKLHV